MRIALTLSLLVCPIAAEAQEWATIDGQQYMPFGFVQQSTGCEPGNRQFKVNKYNNWIWMAMDNVAHGFDSSGNYFKFDDSNEPWFVQDPNWSTILDFDFTSSNTFLVDRYNGILKYDGSNWTQIASSNDYRSVCVDVDSAWFPNDGTTTYFMWKDGVPSIGGISGLQRAAVKNGEMWANGWLAGGTLYRIINDVAYMYQADTSLLLDNANYDFKFSPNTDTLYTAGAMGISLAHNGIFFDSITPGNTTNMPDTSILEFEIDQYDNIWALFGTDVLFGDKIGYYEQATKTWTQVYDASNSPINFFRVSIELDSAGNLYVVDDVDLHILKVNNWPTWVGIEEQAVEPFRIYPNPASDVIHIEGGNIGIENYRLINCHGKIMTEFSVPQIKGGMDVSKLECGIYFIEAVTDGQVVSTQKWIKL